MTSGRGIPGSQEVVAAGGSAPTRLWVVRAAGWQDCPACRQTDFTIRHTRTPRAARLAPSPPPPLKADPAPTPLPLLPSQPAPSSLPRLTPTHPDPLRRAWLSVAGHQTGSSRVQDGGSAPAPSALPAGSRRPLTRRARAQGLAKNSQAQLYLVPPDPGAATRSPPRPAWPRPAPR